MVLRPLGTSLLLALLPVSLLVSTAGAQPDTTPVAPVVETFPLETVVAAEAGSPQPSTSSAEIPLDGGVHVLGVTWDVGAAANGVTAELRQRAVGSWSTWESLDVEEAAEDDRSESRAGTQPFVVDGSDIVQVRLARTNGALPAGARVDVVHPGSSAADATAGSAAVTSSAAAKPTVLTRAAWGADESLRNGSPSFSPVRAAVIHHTAGSNTYTESETASVIRGIYAFHVNSRGWSDIGYNMLADRFGRLWEGRYGGVDNPVVGAHVAGYNTGSFGISVMGTFDSVAPPTATIDAVTRAIAWKLSLYGVSATDTTTLAGASIPTVVGHRDLGQTACPGAAIHAKIPAMRTAARAYQLGTAPTPTPTPSPTPTPTPTPTRLPMNHDLTGDGFPDVLSRTSSEVRLSVRVPLPVRSAVQIGTNWRGMDSVLGSPDLGGDAYRDILARQPSTGRLWIHHGNGRGGFLASTRLGPGWNGMSHLLAPGDWNGDGRADLLAVEAASGRLFLYRGTGAGFSSGVLIGVGWQSMTLLTKAGDLDGDGRLDLVAVDGAGALRLYSGNGRGGFLGSSVVSADWSGYDALVGSGDFDGDGRADLVARTVGGRMASLHGTSGATLEPAMEWGLGWGALNPLDGPGDWNGDGRTDLLAVSPASGALLLYPGLGARHYTASRPVSIPAADARHVFVVGDVDGAGRPDVVTVDTLGRVHLSLVTGDGIVGARRQIGSGWSGMDVVTAAGDLTADGIPDVLARQLATSDLFVYPMTRSGSFGTAVQVGHGWGDFDEIVGVGPWDEGLTADIVARRSSDGALFLYRGSSSGSLEAAEQIGSRWSDMRQIIGAGDLDDDGFADLLARTSAGVDLVFQGDGTGGFALTWQMQGLPRDVVLS